MELFVIVVAFGPWIIALSVFMLMIKERHLRCSWTEAHHLTLLRRELERLHTAGDIDEEVKTRLTPHIDMLVDVLSDISGAGDRETAREEQLNGAWKHLCEYLGNAPLPYPPWETDKNNEAIFPSAKVYAFKSLPQVPQNTVRQRMLTTATSGNSVSDKVSAFVHKIRLMLTPASVKYREF
jgi:hypothetical protein